MHIPAMPWLHSSNGHRTPEKFVGTIKVTHTVDPKANFIVRDEHDRPFLLTEVLVDMWSDPNQTEVNVELIGRRTTKAMKADLRSTPDTIAAPEDKIVANVCEVLNISLDPADLIAQAFPKH